MIDKLKPYTEYKESGLPWLGGIASGWRTLRGKGVFSAVDVRSETGKEELLSVSASDGVVPRSQKTVTMFKAKSYIGHKLCWPGDLVVNSIWAWMQGLGVARHHGLISSAYSVYRPRQEFTDYGRFFHYLLRSAAYKWELQTRSKGVWISRLQLLDIAFMDMPVLLPPPDEQAAIVRFLDHTNRRIDRFIRAKKKVIALLNEQKQAIIHRTVTRGLDPNVPLKPSGIPWLGEIPKHWEVRPIKHWAKLNSRLLTERTNPDYEFKYLDIGTVGTGRLVREPERIKFKNAPSRARRVIHQGDTIISTVRTYLKAIYFVDTPDSDLVASTGFAVLSPGPDVLPEFLSFGIQSSKFIDRVTANSIGIAYPAIAESRLGTFHLAIPPNKTEQASIMEYVRTRSMPFDTAITRTEREISLLR